MVKIRIMRPTVCGGRPVEAGAVVEADERDASYLLALGKAVPHAGAAPRPEERESDQGLTTRKAAVLVKRGRGGKRRG